MNDFGSDPDFVKLSPEAKRIVLQQTDPEFSALSPEAQTIVIQSLSGTTTPPAPESSPLDLATGFGNQLAKTVLGIAGIVSPKARELAARPEIQPPDSGWGKTGMTIANVASILSPGRAGSKAVSAIKNPIARNAAGLGMDSLLTGIIGAGQAGGDIERGLADAEITLGLGALAYPVAALMNRVGSKIQMKAIMPRSADFAKSEDYMKGVAPESAFSQTVQKMGLTGNLRDSFRQVTDRLTNLRLERKALLGSDEAPKVAFSIKPAYKGAVEEMGEKTVDDISDPETIRKMILDLKVQAIKNGKKIPQNISDVYDITVKNGVDLGEVLRKTKKELYSSLSNYKHLGLDDAIRSSFDRVEKQVGNGLNKYGAVSIEKAEDAKESIGLLGSWAYGGRDLDSNATEIVANHLYANLRKAIEDALPQKKELLALNKEMQRLIPVKSAMIARIPVEERQAMMSLPTLMGMLGSAVTGHAMGLAIPAVDFAQKSMRFGNWLNRTAPSMPNAGVNIGRTISGTLPTLGQ